MLKMIMPAAGKVQLCFNRTTIICVPGRRFCVNLVCKQKASEKYAGLDLGGGICGRLHTVDTMAFAQAGCSHLKRARLRRVSAQNSSSRTGPRGGETITRKLRDLWAAFFAVHGKVLGSRLIRLPFSHEESRQRDCRLTPPFSAVQQLDRSAVSLYDLA